jgi:hypothetical protein
MRKHIFPSLMDAYDRWCETHDTGTIENIAIKSRNHWQNIAEQMLALHQQDAEQCSVRIEALVKENHI